jgi:hypothetical protein
VPPLVPVRRDGTSREWCANGAASGEIGVAEQAARAQQHHEQQDHAEEQVRNADVEPLRIAELAERPAHQDDDGADDGPGDGAHATDDEHRSTSTAARACTGGAGAPIVWTQRAANPITAMLTVQAVSGLNTPMPPTARRSRPPRRDRGDRRGSGLNQRDEHRGPAVQPLSLQGRHAESCRQS